MSSEYLSFVKRLTKRMLIVMALSFIWCIPIAYFFPSSHYGHTGEILSMALSAIASIWMVMA